MTTDNNMTLIKEALYAFAAEENAQIERAIESGPKPPESLYLSCREIAKKIATEKKKALPFKKAIAVLVAATLIISLLTVVVYAARNKIGEFFVDFFEKYAELTHENTEENNYNPSNVSTTYLPEGYSETRKNIGIASALYEWNNNDKIITLQISTFTNGSHAIDIEDSNYTTIEVNDFTVFRTEKHGEIDARWTDENMVYTLSATGIEWDEMVKIIEGIKIEE